MVSSRVHQKESWNECPERNALNAFERTALMRHECLYRNSKPSLATREQRDDCVFFLSKMADTRTPNRRQGILRPLQKESRLVVGQMRGIHSRPYQYHNDVRRNMKRVASLRRTDLRGLGLSGRQNMCFPSSDSHSQNMPNQHWESIGICERVKRHSRAAW